MSLRQGKINDPSDFPYMTYQWDQKRLDYSCQEVALCRVMIRVPHSASRAVIVAILPAYKLYGSG
jgi:hypothetical protein